MNNDTNTIGTCQVCMEGPQRLFRLPEEWTTIEDRDHPDNQWCADCIADGEPPTDEEIAASHGWLPEGMLEAFEILALEIKYQRS